MAEFNLAYKKVLSHEGGYVHDPDDPGGETYKGVARKMHSKWNGWTNIDILKKQAGFPANLDKNADLQQQIEEFYQTMFWDKIKGDDINDQELAISIFDFAVNAGTSTSASLAQMVVEAKPDGVIGPITLKKINEFNPDHLLSSFTVAKIARYISIVKRRPTSRKYFYGWVRRALNDI
jgi:lysozyme family protein